MRGGAAALAAACGTTSPQPAYGAPIPDASNDDAAQNDASPGPMYGAVMPDAGDAGPDAPATFYGGPPIDSGTSDQ